MRPRYNVGGKDLFSVTQILKMKPNPALDKWKKVTRNHAAIAELRSFIGNVVHWRIYSYFCRKMGRIPDPIHLPPMRQWGYLIDGDVVNAIQVIWTYFMDWVREHDVEPIYLEKEVHDLDLEFAGTFDFYGIMDGKRVLIDWKTARHVWEDHSYGAQLNAYEWCGVKMELFEPVERLIVVRLNEETGKEMVPVIRDWKTFMGCWLKFRVRVMKDVPWQAYQRKIRHASVNTI